MIACTSPGPGRSGPTLPLTSRAGTDGLRRRICPRASRPVRCGIIWSRMTRSIRSLSRWNTATASWPCGEERIEDLVAHLSRDARAGILHPQLDEMPRPRLRVAADQVGTEVLDGRRQ